MNGVGTLAIALAAALAAGPALAQGASTVTHGTATIVDPPRIAQQSELMVAPVAKPSGKVAVTATGAAARYSVGGVAGDSFSLAVPGSLKLVRSGGSEEVLLTLTPSGATGTLAGEAGTRASAEVDVGGAVKGVTGAAAPGVYQGDFQVILNLQ